MSRYINTGDVDLLKQAHEAASKIEDVAAKGNALMQLADELDIARAEQATDEADDKTNQSDNDSQQETDKDNGEQPVENVDQPAV